MFIKVKDTYVNPSEVVAYEFISIEHDDVDQGGNKLTSEFLAIHLKTGAVLNVEGPKTLLGQFNSKINQLMIDMPGDTI